MPFGSDPFASFIRRRRPAPVEDDEPQTVADEFRGTELSLDPFDAFMTRRKRQGPGLSDRAKAIESGLEWFYEKPIEPATAAADRFAEWTSNKGGRVLPYVGAFAEGVAQQATPANLLLTAAGLKTPGKIPGLRTPGGVVPASRSAESMLALRDLARTAESGIGAFQVGEGAAAAKDAYERGDYKEAALAGGMAALGAFGAVTGTPGLRRRYYDVRGELLPAGRQPLGGEVVPPDIDVRGGRPTPLLEGPTIDAEFAQGFDDGGPTDGETLPPRRPRPLPPGGAPILPAGSPQRLLPRDGGLPPAEPIRLPRRTPDWPEWMHDPELRDAYLESILNGENPDEYAGEIARRGPRPLPPSPTGAAATMEPSAGNAEPPRSARTDQPELSQPGGTPVAEGIDLAAERKRLAQQGFPPELIDRVIADFTSGKSVEPPEGTPGTVRQPDPRMAQLPSLDERMAAARARNQPPVETNQPPVENNALEELLGMTRQAETALDNPARAFEDLTTDANVDELTKVQNRRGWERSGDGAPKPGRIIGRLDADNFKSINDKLGHAEGDRALQVIGDTLSQFARRAGDRVARLGGDEFGLDLEAPNSPEAATALRDRVEQAVASALREAGFPEDLGVSLGFGADEKSADASAIARKAERGVSRPREVANGAPEGVNAGGGPLERVNPDAGGMGLPGGNGDRALRGRAPRRSPAEDELFAGYLDDARAQGYSGSDDELRALFNDRLRSANELIEDLSGAQSDADIFRIIREEGGIDPTYGSGNRGARSEEIASLVELLDKAGMRGGNSIIRTGAGTNAKANRLAVAGRKTLAEAKRRLAAGEISQAEFDRTATKVSQSVARYSKIRPGRGLDELAEVFKNQHPALGINTDWDLLEELKRQLTERIEGTRPGVPDLNSVLEGALGMKRGTPWWMDEGDTSFNPPEDVLSTGEVQPRLPGDVGAVRGAENKTPEFEAPFSLSPEASKASDAAQIGLRDVEEAIGSNGNKPPADLTVYHGTPAEFENFDPNVSTFFAEDPSVAESFATGSNKKHEGPYRPRMIAAKLPGVENALDITGLVSAEDAAQLGGDLAVLKKAVGQRDWPAVREILGNHGYDALRFPYHKGGNVWMVPDPTKAVTPAGVPLGSTEPPTSRAPIARKVPENVRDFLVKQLGYTDEDLARMSPQQIYKIGRERTRNPEAPPRPSKPVPVETKAYGESYNPDRMQNIADELEQFLELEVPRRQQQIAARTERVKATRGVELERVHRTSGEGVIAPSKPERSVAPPITKRGLQKTIEAVNARAEEQTAEARELAARAGETPNERQSRVARIQGEQRGALKDMQETFDRGDYKSYAKKIGEAAEKFWKRSLKMGTRVEDDEPGQFLGAGLGMAQAILNDPKKYALLAGEMLRNPAVRAAIGATIGGAVDDDERMRGALYGAILAAGAPSGLKAMLRSVRNVREGKPLFYDAKKKNVAAWRVALGANLEASVPDVFKRVREMELELDKLYDSAFSKETKVNTEKHTRQQIGRVLADAAREARAAGMKRKAWMLDAYSRRYKGVPTMGQQNVQRVADMIFGKKKVDARDVERHANTIIHRTLIGYALDSAIANQLQPVLALLHVSPTNLARGFKAAATKRGRELTEFLRLPKRGGEDVISETRELFGKPKPKGGILGDPGRVLRISDDSNRRRVYLGALAQKGWLDRALGGAEIPKDVHEWALSKVRRTQGDPGPLGKNPFHRGPVMGPATAFLKYPGIFLENIADAFNDPEARGKAFVASTIALIGVGKLLGIDMEDLLTSGGRPLGISLTHPGDTLKRGIGVLPVGRAILDAGRHLTGDADHPFASLPGDDFLNSDVASLVFGRYPVKFAKKGGEILSEGLGEHAPESVSDTRPPHRGIDDLANLLGMKTTQQTDAQETAAAARRARTRAVQHQRQQGRDSRRELEDALRSGNQERIRDARRKLTPAQLRDFYRRRNQTPYQRMREGVPRDQRKEFDEQFRERLER